MTAKICLEALDEFADAGLCADMWLRDDDATEPTGPLEHLLTLTGEHGIPVTLAVVPATTGLPLTRFLDAYPHADVAVHGWAHQNYANDGEKKRELGLHRPLAEVLSELQSGYDRLSDLHSKRFVPMLVPPWNRIDDEIVSQLTGIGYRALSVFGPEKPAPITVINTHIDLIDWRGTRGGRDHDTLFAEIAARMRVAVQNGGITGILAHHLDHDKAVWDFLETLFDLTRTHPGCRWRSATELVASRSSP
jgi:hypothetical protein